MRTRARFLALLGLVLLPLSLFRLSTPVIAADSLRPARETGVKLLDSPVPAPTVFPGSSFASRRAPLHR
jgi:hypothetical protein